MRLSRIGVVLIVLTLMLSAGCFFGSKEYTISGTVLDTDGKAIEDVIIHITGGTKATVDKFEDGKWSAAVKGKVTVTPVHDLYDFEPESKEVSKANDKVNFVGTYLNPYNVSGTVLDQDGKVIDGVVINVTGRTTTTIKEFDQDGKWSTTVVGDVILTPYHELYKFEPEFLEVSDAKANIEFEAILLEAYNIAGKILDLDGNPIADSKVKISGQLEREVDVDANGNWQAENVRGKITVTPVKDGFKFSDSILVEEANSNIDFVGIKPKLWYDFTEIDGSTVLDRSNSGNNGTLEGGATVNEGILSLDGIDGYVNLPEGLVADLDNFTISFLVNVKETRAWSRFFDLAGPFGFFYMTPLGLEERTMLTVFTNENSVYGEDHATDLMVDLISTDTWVLITVAVSNKELVVYYDGKLIGTMEAHAQPKDVGSTFDNYIGRSIFVNDPYLYADLSEFCLFNKALTAEQIATLYSLGK